MNTPRKKPSPFKKMEQQLEEAKAQIADLNKTLGLALLSSTVEAVVKKQEQRLLPQALAGKFQVRGSVPLDLQVVRVVVRDGRIHLDYWNSGKMETFSDHLDAMIVLDIDVARLIKVETPVPEKPIIHEDQTPVMKETGSEWIHDF